MRKKHGSINLHVQSRPIITSKSQTFNLNTSSTIVLNCEAYGLPVPDINWFHNGKMIANELNSKYSTLENVSLEIFHLNRFDSGLYSCHRHNLDKYPIVKLNYIINVTESFLNHHSEILIVNETQTVELRCRNHSQSSQENIWTYKDNSNIEFIQSNTILKINKIYLNQTGSFDCLSVTNNGNYLTTYNLIVNSNESSKHITKLNLKSSVNKSIVLDCSTWFETNKQFENKKIKYFPQWKLNGSDFNSNDLKYDFQNRHKTILKINNLTLNETNDEYTCLFDMKIISIFKLSIGGKLSIKQSQ